MVVQRVVVARAWLFESRLTLVFVSVVENVFKVIFKLMVKKHVSQN